VCNDRKIIVVIVPGQKWLHLVGTRCQREEFETQQVIDNGIAAGDVCLCQIGGLAVEHEHFFEMDDVQLFTLVENMTSLKKFSVVFVAHTDPGKRLFDYEKIVGFR
jgi:hypothetical protein